MAVLVLAAAYFTAVHPGLKAKLTALLGHAFHAAKRIFGIPDSCCYALADGIRVILTRSGKRSKAIKQKPPSTTQTDDTVRSMILGVTLYLPGTTLGYLNCLQ